MEIFASWFERACDEELPEPNAMVLATVDECGAPHQRVVLLKYFDRDGFVFFTNYGSNKAKEIAVNPRVSLYFSWPRLGRAMRVLGAAEKTTKAESMRYFMSRPRESQLGAWVSQQSEVVSSRQLLLQKLAQLRQQFRNRDISLPSFWGGYRVKADEFEFMEKLRSARQGSRMVRVVEREGRWQDEEIYEIFE